MDEPRHIRNLGILAHVDAGKTTLTENLLFLSGATRSLGDVNKGTALSDGLAVEKKRGISVRATPFSFSWRDVRINLIDTPGHVDFSAEVERSLRVLDCAVLVLSAVEGIQSHTETLWHALRELNLPVIIFINKLDRAGADAAGVLAKLKREFSPDFVMLNRPKDEGVPSASVTAVSPEQDADTTERIAEKDEALTDDYLRGNPINPDRLLATLSRSVHHRQLFPVLCGVAKNNIGIHALLEAIVDHFPNADTQTEAPLSGAVFRLDHDPKLGRIAGVRLYRGQIKTRDSVYNTTAERIEKITQIKKPVLNKFEDTGILQAGDIGFVCGMPDVQIGDILGDPVPIPGACALGAPLLSVQVIPEDEADHTALAEALQKLASEDPHLNFQWFPDERELHVKIMGVIQTEILTEILSTRFGLSTRFSEPTVIYRETPSRSGFGAERYTMPKPCWAIVTYRIEPGEGGSGLVFASEVRTSDIGQKYQNEIAKNLYEAVHQGPKGWVVTDLKITLVDGSDHVLHSRPGNFRLATNIAILRGLTDIGNTLLEPFLAYRITGPEEFVGKISSDIIAMRGTLEPPDMADGRFTLRGRVPLSTSMNYAVRLGSQSGGKATLGVRFDGYEPCADELGIVRPYKGICPLDRSKYILKMRGAIT